MMLQSKVHHAALKGIKHRALPSGRHKSKTFSCLSYLLYGIFALTFVLSVAIILVTTENTSLLTQISLPTDSADPLMHRAATISAVNGTKTDRNNLDISVRERNDAVPKPGSHEGPLIQNPLIVHSVDFSGKVEEHISMILGGKTGLRQNLRIIMNDANNGAETRPGGHKDREKRNERKRRQIEEDGDGGAVIGTPWAYLEAQKILKSHPLFQVGAPMGGRKEENIESKNENENIEMIPSLEDTMLYMNQHPVCAKTPIFLTMATVGDDLYWQLIENFVYSMVKFEISNCSLVICVSDPKCMRLCNDNNFPCYDYRTARNPLPSVMEQIGEVKLFHIPQAMSKGVDVFMLDLDVGFLSDPRGIVRTFYETPDVDIFVQVSLFL